MVKAWARVTAAVAAVVGLLVVVTPSRAEAAVGDVSAGWYVSASWGVNDPPQLLSDDGCILVEPMMITAGSLITVKDFVPIRILCDDAGNEIPWLESTTYWSTRLSRSPQPTNLVLSSSEGTASASADLMIARFMWVYGTDVDPYLPVHIEISARWTGEPSTAVTEQLVLNPAGCIEHRVTRERSAPTSTDIVLTIRGQTFTLPTAPSVTLGQWTTTIEREDCPPRTRTDCFEGRWSTFVEPWKFANQGDCVQFVETGTIAGLTPPTRP